jgi:phosphatidylserine synthase
MWRLNVVATQFTRTELLHAILMLILCITVLIRDNFAHFMRGIAIRQGQEPEASELNRLRTVVAAPVCALLYAYAFYIPEGPSSRIYAWVSWLGNMPLRGFFIIEITFLIINLGSIAGYTRKYGSYCMDELCLGEARLRRQILTLFPNTLTVMNALMGLLSVFFAYQGRIREAYLLLIGAALFDKLDGALARRLGLTEPLDPEMPPKRITLGGILDDISDGVSFCIVPAWIFNIVMSSAQHSALANIPVTAIAWIYAVAGIGRLIYFTLDKNPIPGFFKGLPTPAGALLVAAPLIMLDHAVDTAGAVAIWGQFCVGIMVLAAILMNCYPLRYLHVGRFMNRRPLVVGINLLVTLTLLLTPYFGYYALLCMGVYLVSPLWTWRISPEVAASEKRSRPMRPSI